MALKIEGIVDGSLHGEEALCGPRRLEALHSRSASPGHMVGALSPNGLSQSLLMTVNRPATLTLPTSIAKWLKNKNNFGFGGSASAPNHDPIQLTNYCTESIT